jgi:hypothetical protein
VAQDRSARLDENKSGQTTSFAPLTSVASDPRAVEREAELLASLNHPNVAGVYGLEESGGVNGDLMPGLSGESDGRNAECWLLSRETPL